MSRKNSLLIVLTYFIVTLLFAKIAMFFISSSDANVQMIITTISNLLILLIVIFFARNHISNSIKNFNKGMLITIIKGYAISYILLLVYNLVYTLFNVKVLESSNEVAVQDLISTMPMFQMTFMVAIFAPIVEELVFRAVPVHIFTGVNGKFKSKKQKIIALFLAVSVFAFIHVTAELVTGVDLMSIISTVMPYIILSAVITYFYVKSNYNIFVAVGIHFLNNSIALLLSYLIINL